jgi:hypothetical protein
MDISELEQWLCKYNEPIDRVCVIDIINDLKSNIEFYENALREIDTHIRSTPEPVNYIINTLKRTLPEYNEYI